MKNIVLTLAMVMAAAPAAADSVTVTIITVPRGATVYTYGGTVSYGYSPVELKWDAGKNFFKDGRCTTTINISVLWPSGASAEVPGLELCANVGKKQQVVFNRPTGVPGQETDAFFALELERLDAQRTSDIEARRRAAWDRMVAALTPPPVVQCVSSLIGSTVYTTCR